MDYCGSCGAKTERSIPPDDDRERAVCSQCATVFYENPKNVVGCLVEHEGRLMLCRRAIQPREGLWTVPGGYQELAESVAEGALRETWEEARARAEVIAPHSILDIPHIGQTYMLFRARLAEARWEPGEETLEIRFSDLADIPWDELAFPVIHYALQMYREDHDEGRLRLHRGAILWRGDGPRYDWRSYDLRDYQSIDLC